MLNWLTVFCSLPEGLGVTFGEMRFRDAKKQAYEWFKDAVEKLLEAHKPNMYREGFGLMKNPIWTYNSDGSFTNISDLYSRAEIEESISGRPPKEVARLIHALTSSTLTNCFLMSEPKPIVGNDYLIAQQVHGHKQMERGIGFASFLFAKFAVLALELEGGEDFGKVFDYALSLPLAIAKLNFRSLDKLRSLQGEDGFFKPEFFEVSRGAIGLSALGRGRLEAHKIVANEETLGCPVTSAYLEGTLALRVLYPWFRDIYKTLVFPEFLAHRVSQ